MKARARIRLFLIALLSRLEVTLTRFDKDKTIYDLWQLLDDIDSMSDIYPYDDELYRRSVDYLQNKRYSKRLPVGYLDMVEKRYEPKDMEDEEC